MLYWKQQSQQQHINEKKKKKCAGSTLTLYSKCILINWCRHQIKVKSDLKLKKSNQECANEKNCINQSIQRKEQWGTAGVGEGWQAETNLSRSYFASKAKAMMAAAMGAEADVPVWLSVQRCLRSVVICRNKQKKQAAILIYKKIPKGISAIN